ncbi:hypothetical protein E4U43_003905, partial [Claviceps pusilla]
MASQHEHDMNDAAPLHAHCNMLSTTACQDSIVRAHAELGRVQEFRTLGSTMKNR